MTRAAARTKGFPSQFSAPGTIPDDMIPQPIGYRIVVRPKPPKDKLGLIELAARTKNADLAVRTIGQIVAVGALAFRTKTEGVDWTADGVAQSLKAGDWVVYTHHSGQKLQFSSGATDFSGERVERFLLVMNDTDVIAKLTPEQAEKYADWVS